MQTPEDYVEHTINSLQPDLRREMAAHVLEGYRYKCHRYAHADSTRWWSVTDPKGLWLSGVEGSSLQHVIPRVTRESRQRGEQNYEEREDVA